MHFMMIPPVNSAITWSAWECQQTVPDWKVWLLAMIETDFIFSPAGAKSNFQLILPIDEPSVRAKYTWSGEGHLDDHIYLSSSFIKVHRIVFRGEKILGPKIFQQIAHLCFKSVLIASPHLSIETPEPCNKWQTFSQYSLWKNRMNKDETFMKLHFCALNCSFINLCTASFTFSFTALVWIGKYYHFTILHWVQRWEPGEVFFLILCINHDIWAQATHILLNNGLHL